MKPTTQSEAVLQFLKKKGSITDLQAFKLFGIRRLSSIIHRLRSKKLVYEKKTTLGHQQLFVDGFKIKTEQVKFKSKMFGFTSWYAKYTLNK